MPITQDVLHCEYCDGELVGEPVVEVVDVTAECVLLDLHTKLRAALAANQQYIANAPTTAAPVAQQVLRLTRQVNALLRLALATPDLMTENTDT